VVRQPDGTSARLPQELRDIGIGRMDIAAIRAGTYKRDSSDIAE